jgi:hypothetical protein
MNFAYITTIVFFVFISITSSIAQGPQFTWAKSMGGPGAESAVSIAQDQNGNILTTGTFAGTADFNPGAAVFNLTAPIFAPFISKLDSKGDFAWAKQLGIGNGYAICVDSEGNVYTVGRFTGVGDFDPGSAVFNLTSVGNTDIFISKLDSMGNFVWAKRMGGIEEDAAYDIEVKGDTLILTGAFKNTADFDPGPNSFNILADFIDVFVAAINTDGEFLWAKKMGGGKGEDGLTGSSGNSLAIDTAGNIIVTGFFSSTGDFDPGTNKLEFVSNGDEDIFIVKLDPNGNFIWGFPLGGPGQDIGRGIAVDLAGHVYITGSFERIVDFDPEPSTSTEYEARGSDIFIASYHLNGFIQWAKQIGSPLDDQANAIYVDQSSGVHTTGSFWQTADFDPGPGEFPLSTILNDHRDIFISSLGLGGGFISAVRMGGLQNDQGNAIMVDLQNNLVTTGGFTGFVDFDPGAPTFHITGAGGSDIFVQKLCQAPIMNITGPLGFCPGASATLTSDLADQYLWSTGETTQSIVVTMPGLYSLTVTNGNGCTGAIERNIEVHPAPDVPVISGATAFCDGDSIIISTGSATAYLWSTGEMTQSISVNETGIYSVTVYNQFGCQAESELSHIMELTSPTLTIVPVPGSTEFCEGDSLVLNVSNAAAYLWSTGETTQSITIKTSGDYSVTITDAFGCMNESNVIEVTVFPIPQIDLGDAIILEEGDSITISAGTGFATYSWSTGETTNSIVVDSMGIYSVTVSNSNGCTAEDSVLVTIVTSVHFDLEELGIQVFPNPAREMININSKKLQIDNISLLGQDGRVLLISEAHLNPGDQKSLDIQSLSPGTYFVKIQCREKIFTVPIMKL